jgi:hypothetical protein
MRWPAEGLSEIKNNCRVQSTGKEAKSLQKKVVRA